MNPMKPLVLMSFLFVSVLPVKGIAADPWSEKAIPAPVDLGDYTGRLNKQQLESLIEAGRVLFSARFTIEDGVGRPMATQAIIPTKRKRPPRNSFSRTAGLDANACASCHNAPVVGGAGDFTANVFVSEGFQHSDFDTTDPQFSNERNTNHLMGSGLVELLAREMSSDLLRLRSDALSESRQQNIVIKTPLISKGVKFGWLTVHPDGRVDTVDISGVDHDLIIRPYSQKGVMTSLRQFTINALNHHHGMQASERFGPRWTKSSDFDEDGIEREITPGDVSALVAWQATLAPPVQTPPDDQRWAAAALKGQKTAENIGCLSCHMSYLPLKSLSFSDPGPLDAAGTLRTGEIANTVYDMALLEWSKTLEKDDNGFYKIPLFGDLKRHVIADQQVATLGNELLSQRFVERNVFMTTELWGIAST
ncbi:MAG: hypothetical protein ACJAUZ_001264, partial [Flavobacteriaceae bacterium]